MKLDDYLTAIKDCPDEIVKHDNSDQGRIHRLTADYGVYDNYHILTSLSSEQIDADLQNAQTFLNLDYTKDLEESRFKGKPVFRIEKGKSALSIYPKLTVLDKSILDCFNLKEGLFNSVISIHQGAAETSALVSIICDLSQYLVRTKSNICFPTSMGIINMTDTTKMVFYPDKLEEEMMQKLPRQQR